jgi:cbb3-type cytochrome oxidase maturation protein
LAKVDLTCYWPLLDPSRTMDILYLLLPLSVVLVLIILGFLGWSVYRGQFDDLDQEAVRILEDDQEKP